MRATLPNGWLMCDEVPALPDAPDFAAFAPCNGRSMVRMLEKHARTINGMQPDLFPKHEKISKSINTKSDSLYTYRIVPNTWLSLCIDKWWCPAQKCSCSQSNWPATSGPIDSPMDVVRSIGLNWAQIVHHRRCQCRHRCSNTIAKYSIMWIPMPMSPTR